MAQKTKRKPVKRKPTSNRRRINCTKSHGHLVCWVTTKTNPKRRRIFFNFIISGTHNNHTPGLIRSHGLILVAFLLVGLQLAYNYNALGKPKILGYATNVSAKDVAAAVNEARTAEGLPPLEVNQTLGKAASLKADHMLSADYWAHDSPDGVQPWHWYDQAQYSYQAAGENLAKGFHTSKALATAWMNSPSHRKNMLNPNFKDMGIAVVNGELEGDPTTLVVAHFGLQKDQQLAVAQDPNSILGTTTASQLSILSSPAYISALASPISIVSLGILLFVFMTAALAHWRYIKLPKKVRKSWYKHHGLYAGLLACFAIVYIAYIFTSGSI